jgi:hypothetical protein
MTTIMKISGAGLQGVLRLTWMQDDLAHVLVCDFCPCRHDLPPPACTCCSSRAPDRRYDPPERLTRPVTSRPVKLTKLASGRRAVSGVPISRAVICPHPQTALDAAEG